MILIILLIASILRFTLSNQSFWLDEAINVNNVTSSSFQTLIFHYSLGDFHPPFFHIILKSWILLTNLINYPQFLSETIIRTPSIVFGILTVFVTYQIGKILYEKKTAIIAATLMATAPLHIYYSQEARMYSLAAFVSALSVYFFIKLIKKDTLIIWVGFIISTTVVLYSDYLPYFIIPAYLLYLLINRKHIPKATIRAFIPAFIIIFILFIPWLIIFPRQLHVGLSAASASPSWSQVVGSNDPKSLILTFVKFSIGRISHDNNLIYALLFSPIAAFFTFLLALSTLRMTRLRSFIWYWILTSITLAYLISFFVPVYSYFRLVFLLPAFYLLLSSAINIINWPPLTRTLLALALIVNIGATTIYFSFHKFQREDWRTATNYVVQNSTQNSIVLFESSFSAAPFDYYNRGRVEATGALSGFNADSKQVKQNVARLTDGKNKVFLFQYLTQITDPQGLVFKELSDEGFINTSTKDFTNVGFLYEFEK